MSTLNMSPLNRLMGLAFGLALPLAAVSGQGSAIGPVAHQSVLAVQQLFAAPFQAMGGRRDAAEVHVAFDGKGRVAGAQLRRSTGSRRADVAAVAAAVELAGLRRPTDVAGHTLVIRANLDAVLVREAG